MSMFDELERLLLDAVWYGESLSLRAENREYSDEKLQEHEEDWVQSRAAWFADKHGGERVWEQ